MNHLVPTSTSAGGASRPRMADDDDIMELLWQNGQVVMQSQNQRAAGKRSEIGHTVLRSGQNEIPTPFTAAPAPGDVSDAHHHHEQQQHHLFMQEDEMASWLHYPLDDNPASFDPDFCTDFLYSPPPPPPTVTAAAAAEVKSPRKPVTVAARPPVGPPPVRAAAAEVDNSRFSNFAHFSKTKPARVAAGAGPSASKQDDPGKSTTVVDSSITPAIEHNSRVSHLVRTTGADIGSGISGAALASTSSAGGRDTNTCDLTATPSPGGSTSISVSVEPTTRKVQAAARKRKAAHRAADEAECYSEDVQFEPANAKKQAQGPTSVKRSRAAEVHNLSERRRRDRINEKMKALQELIPRCNKADKASMLDEAIEYLKSLQMQVQMMSMGCSIVPMMFPGGQHYMQPMGMGMDMSMSRPMVPYPSVFAGSPMPNPSTPSHLGPRFPAPAYHHMQPVPRSNLSRLQTAHHSDPTLNPMASQNLIQPQLPNFPNPYQGYLGPNQMPLPVPQNQAVTQPNTTEPSTTTGTLGHHQSG